MSTAVRTLLAVTLAILASQRSSAQDPRRLLTEDGKMLKATLEVHDHVRQGFTGDTGKTWTIKPDGEWTIVFAKGPGMKEEKKGKLTPEQLQALAKDLAKFDPTTLPEQTGKVTQPVRREVKVKLGKQEALLTLPLDAELPDPKNPEKLSPTERFAGVRKVVEKALADAGEPDKNEGPKK